MHEKPFEELEVDFEGSLVLLDVDGTLAGDGSLEFDERVLQKLSALKKTNQVLLCTNKRDRTRFEELERRLGARVVTRRYRKPSKKILEEVGEKNLPRVVIGDKVLTDGWFARKIGARFIKVSRVYTGTETLSVRAMNILDDFLWNILKKLFS